MVTTLCLKLLDVPGSVSNKMNMKLIGKFVGVFKMFGGIETSWSQTEIPFSFDCENMVSNPSKVFCNFRFGHPATNGHTVASLGAEAGM